MQVALDAVQEIKDLCRKHPDKVRILEDSKEIAYRGFCVDPLRLTLRFAVKNNQLIDDNLCEKEDIYCELNLKSCVNYHISIYSTKLSLAALKSSIQRVLEAWDWEKGVSQSSAVQHNIDFITQRNSLTNQFLTRPVQRWFVPARHSPVNTHYLNAESHWDCFPPKR